MSISEFVSKILSNFCICRLLPFIKVFGFAKSYPALVWHSARHHVSEETWRTFNRTFWKLIVQSKTRRIWNSSRVAKEAESSWSQPRRQRSIKIANPHARVSAIQSTCQEPVAATRVNPSLSTHRWQKKKIRQVVCSTSLQISGALPRTVIAVSKTKGSNRVENLRMAQKNYFRPKIPRVSTANHSVFLTGKGSSPVPEPRISARFMSRVSHVPRLHLTVNFESPVRPSITVMSWFGDMIRYNVRSLLRKQAKVEGWSEAVVQH